MRFFNVTLVFFVSLVLSGFIPLGHADRGGFPVSVIAERVSESGQKAIIAWNGTHEVLILSTDVNSTQEVEVVEIMPLPSNPTISKGEKEAFVNVQELVNNYFEIDAMLSQVWVVPRFPGGTFTMGGEGTAPPPPKITITFYTTIGVHDITVVKAEEANELIQWLQDFLRNKGYNGELPSDLEELLGYYIENEMKFFAMDMIKTSPNVTTIDPLIYEFESSRLYYPLRISTLFSGDTEISLFTLTSDMLDDSSIVKQGFVKKAQFQIRQEALAKISPNITQLFSGNSYLCYFSFTGSLEKFNGDILASSSRSPDTLAMSMSISSAALLCLLLLFPKNKLVFHLKNNSVEIARLLEITLFILGICGVVLTLVGCWLFPWGFKAYGDLLVPIRGPFNGLNISPLAVIIIMAIVYSFSLINPVFVYLQLDQRNSKDVSSNLITGGICIMLLVVSCASFLQPLDVGAYIMLTGGLFVILTGVLIRIRLKLSHQL